MLLELRDDASSSSSHITMAAAAAPTGDFIYYTISREIKKEKRKESKKLEKEKKIERERAHILPYTPGDELHCYY